MGLEESVCCKQILISGSLKVAERRKQNFRSQLCQSPMDCNMEEVKGQKGLLCSKSPMCTLSQNGYSACSVRFGSISGDICQVQFQRWRGLHPMKKGRKKHRGS